MKKFILLLLLLQCLSSFSQVSDKDFVLKKDSILGWHQGGVFMLNMSQSSFKNWSAGGEDMFSYNGLLNYYLRYNDGNIFWDNNLDLALGLVHQGSVSKKTDDKIDIASKVGKSISEHWYYAGLVNFKTQFRQGYNYPDDSTVISNFMAPAYLITALGFDYKPRDFLSVFLAPVSSRLTIVTDQALADSGAYGVDRGKNSRFEFGGYARLLLQKDIMANVNLSTKFEAFSNYLDKPQNIALNGEVLISMKVNKYLGASVSAQVIYDDAVKYKNGGPRVQFREVIGVGLSYQF